MQAIVGIGAELDWIAHTALEATRIIPPALQTTPYICVLKLGDAGLLLAGEQEMLLAVRPLPLARLDGAPLAAEIQSTFAYLQRHGWQQTRDLAFIGFGVDLPTVPNLTFTRIALYPEADGYAELLAHLVQARKPLQSLTQPRLQRRKGIQTFQHALTYAAMAAAVFVMSCFRLLAIVWHNPNAEPHDHRSHGRTAASACHSGFTTSETFAAWARCAVNAGGGFIER